jgi:rhodanese-related sulfurtransferase
MDASITADDLRKALGTGEPPLVIDVRRRQRFQESPDLIKGALRRDPEQVEEWKKSLPHGTNVVVYCVHGHEVSQNVAKALGARYLEGGIEHWRGSGGELSRKPQNGASRWVTRERPKIDRIACPWLIRRFIDPLAAFHFVTAEWVIDVAEELGAIPYDVKDVRFSHRGETCSFDTFLDEFGLEDPALLHLARIVRGADTARPDLEPQAAGLLALSLGLSAIEADDLRQLEKAMILYDALYGWVRHASEETHNWPAVTA